MRKLDYFKIIHKYIPPYSLTYRIYITHVTLVTAKALDIARRLKLSPEQQQFIEEACMLHDIGIIKVNAEEIGCHGDLPYIAHIIEGRKILEDEGLPLHAKIAENHVGVGGLTKKEITDGKIPLPQRDIICETIEEKIISYADLFYSKNPRKLFAEKPLKQVQAKVKKYGKRQEKLFKEWYKLFEGKKPVKPKVVSKKLIT
ncbi:MAG: HD domain-containing protein [Sphingobacteriales bacterium]|nr:MAG: HD domain-containing protein [Sphingobacteriales bacterium]